MPIWLERFLLPLLAGAIFSLVVLNTMKLNLVQRYSLGIAICAVSVFVADLIHTNRHPVEQKKPDFITVNLLGFIACDQTESPDRAFWGKYTSPSGVRVTPIDCVVSFQIATKENPVTINSFYVEVPTMMKGYMALRRVPMDTVTLYAGHQSEAKPIEFDHPEIYSLVYQELQPWKTYNGYAAFEYSDTSVPSPPSGVSSVRVTVNNALGDTETTEARIREVPDPFSGGLSRFKIVGPPTDLTAFQTERFSEFTKFHH